MKNIRKALAFTSVAVALILGFSPAQATSFPRNIDVQISSASVAIAPPAFFGWLCRIGICD